MPVLLFKLKGAHQDEVEDVRALLEANGIEFYETHAGAWGIGTHAIWLRDAGRLTEARVLLDEYQAQRALRVRGEYEAAKREGRVHGLLDVLRANPLAVLLALAFILFILYISLAPFLNMGEWL
jgi:hypothetical protein